MRKTSPNGISLIKKFEGLRLTPYRCQAGVLTIGYGHTASVVPGMKITRQEAEEFLKQDLEFFEALVSRHVKVPLNQNEFDALVSFAFNVGPGNATRAGFTTSTLLKKLNAHFPRPNASQELLRWTRAGGRISEGLVRRRNAEMELFNRPVSAAP